MVIAEREQARLNLIYTSHESEDWLIHVKGLVTNISMSAKATRPPYNDF